MAPEEKPAAADSMADAREVVGYLVRPEASDYIAIMDVLEGSVTDLTVSEVATALAAGGLRLDARLVESGWTL